MTLLKLLPLELENMIGEFDNCDSVFKCRYCNEIDIIVNGYFNCYRCEEILKSGDECAIKNMVSDLVYETFYSLRIGGFNHQAYLEYELIYNRERCKYAKGKCYACNYDFVEECRLYPLCEYCYLENITILIKKEKIAKISRGEVDSDSDSDSDEIEYESNSDSD